MVLDGLTPLEAIEFRLLDASMPFGGRPVWPSDGLPRCHTERRWNALWQKHLDALGADNGVVTDAR